MNGVKEEAVLFLEDWKNRFAAHRCPATECDSDFVNFEELLGFLRKEWPIGSPIDNDRFNFFPKDTALGIDFVEGEHENIAQRSLADRHCSAERVKHTDLHGIFIRSAQGRSKRRGQSGDKESAE